MADMNPFERSILDAQEIIEGDTKQAEMQDRGPTVRDFLGTQLAGKASVIDRAVQILGMEGFEYVGELKELTYAEVIGFKVPTLAAKRLEPLLKVPPATAPQAASVLPPSDRVEELVRRFGVRLREARDVALERNELRHSATLPVDGLGNLIVPARDPGVYFPILGRQETLGKLVHGGALAYQNFTRPKSVVSEDEGVRHPHFNALVAYPGAGKSTIGTDFPSLLREFWKSGEAESSLTSLGDCSGFVKMVNDSLELNYNACLYHNVDRHERGRLYGVERELAAIGSYGHILALRLLFASLSKPVHSSESYESYDDLLGSLHHLAKQVTLNDVLAFFRKVMNPSHGRPILLSLFLDEINGAEVGTLGTSWIQEVVSSYVTSLRGTRQTNVLLIMSVACTEHKAASLRLTASRRTPHVPIPVHPLAVEDCLAAVTGYFTRLAFTLGRPEGFVASENLKLCVSLTGGMPRYLGCMVRGMYTDVATDAIPAAGLLDRAQKFTTDVLLRTLSNTIRLTQWQTYKYRTGAGFALLLCALRHSLLCTEVHRSEQVTPGNEETWGHLEQRGLVALVLNETHPVVEPEDTPCRVLFPPLLALAMQDGRTDYFGTSFPSPLECGFRQRELSDLKFVSFMIFLVKSPLQDPPRDFSLMDIIPKVWDMAEDLKLLRLPYPEQGQVEQLMTTEHVTGALLQALIPQVGSCFSLMASGNFGLDSVHVLGDFLIITQTRSSDDAKHPPESTASRIFWSCLSDLMGVARLEHLTTRDLEEFLPVPHELRKEVKRFCEELEYSPPSDGEEDGENDVPDAEMDGEDDVPDAEMDGEEDEEVDVPDAKVDGEKDGEVDVPAGVQGCYDLANIVYIYSSDHVVSESARLEIMKSKNPLCRRMIIKQAASSGAFDLLSKVRHLSTLKVV